MGDKNEVRMKYVIFTAGGFVFLLLHFIAAHTSSPLWWGVDSWRYMLSFVPYILLAAGILSYIPSFQQLIKPLVKKLGHHIARIPLFVWLAFTGIIFFTFRQKTFFLGDGQLRVRNTEVYHLFSFDEPLDTLFHTLFYKLLHPAFGVKGAEIYQYISILSGVIAVWGMIYILGRLYKGSGERWFIGCLMATCGSIQLFFGYVESYTIVNCLVLLFLFTGLFMLKQRRLTVVPVILLAGAVITHPLAVLFSPGAFYAYKKVIHTDKTIRSAFKLWLLITGIFSAIVGLLVIMFWIGGNTPAQFLKHYLQGSNLLPLSSNGEVHGIFSASHLVDMLNEIGLVVPAWVSLIIILPRVRSIQRTHSVIFLLLCCIGPLLFLGAFNPKLGYARDWDIFGIIAFPATLLLGVLIIESIKMKLFKIAFPLVAISFLHTAPWIGINASRSVSLKRFELLTSTSCWTDHAKAMAHESLASYYFDTNDFKKSVEHYQKAYELTGNIRFFRNVLATCRKLNDLNILRKFVEKNSQIAEGHFYLGLGYFEQNKLDSALKEFGKVLALDPEYPEVHFQLGLTYVNKEQYDDGIREYKKALIRPQKKYVLSLIHNNLGNAYIYKNMINEGVAEYLEAIKIKPDFPLAHYNLAYTYHGTGKDSLAVKHAELAMKYGYPRHE
ncbi:tetratricopeptide repeat protein, partial [Candidatus Latescibacterota bacterium]